MTDPPRNAPQVVELVRWTGPWPDDDPDANFKADVALYTMLDPLTTIEVLSNSTGIPVGALVRYVLARWASAGSESLLSAGPSVIERMSATFADAEQSDTTEARLAAYEIVRQMVAWLRVPLDEPPVLSASDEPPRRLKQTERGVGSRLLGGRAPERDQ